jgi:hypothetical protein
LEVAQAGFQLQNYSITQLRNCFLMASELYNIIEGVSREKGIDPQIVVSAVEDAIVMATRKHYKSQENFRAKLDKEWKIPTCRLRWKTRAESIPAWRSVASC